MQLLRYLILGMALSFALPTGAQNLVLNWDFSKLISDCNQDVWSPGANIRSESEYLENWFGENNVSVVPSGRNNLMYSFVHDCKKTASGAYLWKNAYPGNPLRIIDFPLQCDTFIRNIFPYAKKGTGYVYITVLDTFAAKVKVDFLNNDCSHTEILFEDTITSGSKSFLQVKLKDSLRTGQKYVVEYFVYPLYLNRLKRYAIDDLGVHLSTDTFKVKSSYKASFSPNLTFPEIVYKEKWHHQIGSFTAKGKEKFLSLGNFNKARETDAFGFKCDSPCTGNNGANLVAFPPTYFYDAVMLYRPEDTVFNAFLPPNNRFCEGDEVTLTAQDTGFKLTEPIRSYQWSTGDTTQSITVDSAGTYTVTVWYDDRWWDTASFTYRLHPEYQSELPDSVRSCPDRQVTLRANPAAPNQELQWSDGTLSNSLTVQAPDTVVLTAITPCDTVRDTVVITGNACPPDLEEPEFAVPDAFTPNGDGLNDTWDIYNLPENNEVWVMNRWGEILFRTKNYRGEWDGTNQRGKPLPGGVYIYKIVYYWGENSIRGVKQGHVTLIRR